MRPVRFARLVPRLTNVASQVLVAVLATVLVSTLIGNLRSAPDKQGALTGKFTTRIPGVADPNMTQAPFPQYATAPTAANLLRPIAFTPALPEPAPVKPAVVRARPRDVAAVLPPPRPKGLAAEIVEASAPAAASSTAVASVEPRGLVIAGLALPTPSVDLKRFAPTGETLTGAVDTAKSAVDWLVHVAIR